MKKLELNQMEKLEGGLEPKCGADIGIHAVVGGFFGGPWGYVIGAAYGYYVSPNC